MDTRLITQDDIRRAIRFHGHICPGLALGIRAAEAALRELNSRDRDEELVAVIESDFCGVDAVQAILGCTFGKGNLVFQNHGKKVFTVFARQIGKSVRIAARPKPPAPPDPEREQLQQKRRQGSASPEENARYDEMLKAGFKRVMDAPLDDLFDIGNARTRLPDKARIFASVPCRACGEEVMEPMLRSLDGELLCLPCFESRLK